MPHHITPHHTSKDVKTKTKDISSVFYRLLLSMLHALDHLAVDCPVLQYSNMPQYIVISLAANVQPH